MNNLMWNLNLQASAQAPANDFELGENVTHDQVMAHMQCMERNINVFDGGRRRVTGLFMTTPRLLETRRQLELQKWTTHGGEISTHALKQLK